MEKIKKKKNDLGFLLIQTGKMYSPLLLNCLISGKSKKHYVSSFKSTPLDLQDEEHVKMWIMYGRNLFGDRHFYCRTESCNELFWLQGDLKFIFDSQQFFELLKYASKKSFWQFAHHCIIDNNTEKDKFVHLILDNWHELTEKQRNRGLAFVGSSARLNE